MRRTMLIKDNVNKTGYYYGYKLEVRPMVHVD